MKNNILKDLDFREELNLLVHPKIVSSAHGQIDTILLSVPQHDYLEGAPHQLLKNLLSVMPSYTKFVIWTESNNDNVDVLEIMLQKSGTDYVLFEKGINERLIEGKKCSVLIAPKQHYFSPWIQDPFMVVKDDTSGSLFLVEPWTQISGLDDDFLLAEHLAHTGLFETIGSPLIFHGGNILVGDDFVLVGANNFYETYKVLIEKTIKGIGSKERYFFFEEFVKNTFSLFVGGKRVIPVGQTKERVAHDYITSAAKNKSHCATIPTFIHIDMYVTLAGRTVAGEYVVLVADPIAIHEQDFRIVRSLKKNIDLIASSLREAGFIVIRNPIPYIGTSPTSRGAYYCLYNNCLVEITDERKKVWMPTFAHGEHRDALLPFDMENTQIWQSLGFEVEPLMNFHSFCKKGGGVRCLVKYLNRT